MTPPFVRHFVVSSLFFPFLRAIVLILLDTLPVSTPGGLSERLYSCPPETVVAFNNLQIFIIFSRHFSLNLKYHRINCVKHRFKVFIFSVTMILICITIIKTLFFWSFMLVSSNDPIFPKFDAVENP